MVPGATMARWLPNKGIRLESPETVERRPAQLRKHVHYISQLEKSQVTDVRNLDEPFTHEGSTTTLRKFIMSLTHPLVPPLDPITGNPIILTEDGHIKMTRDGSRQATPEPLFHGVEMSQRLGEETICEFVSYKDRMPTARSVSRIVPAIVFHKFGVLPPLWFYKCAESVISQVTFEIDQDTGEWNGNWSTQADAESQAMFLEELPCMDEFEFDLSAVMGQLAETRPSMDIQDAASVGTSVNTGVFQAALGHAPAPNAQPAAEQNDENTNNDANNNNNNNNNNGEEMDDGNGENGSNDNTNTNSNDDSDGDSGSNSANGAPADNTTNNNNGSSRVDGDQTQHYQTGVQQDEARTASPVGNVLGSHEGCRPGP